MSLPAGGSPRSFDRSPASSARRVSVALLVVLAVVCQVFYWYGELGENVRLFGMLATAVLAVIGAWAVMPQPRRRGLLIGYGLVGLLGFGGAAALFILAAGSN